jgi:hypothetical protein
MVTRTETRSDPLGATPVGAMPGDPIPDDSTAGTPVLSVPIVIQRVKAKKRNKKKKYTQGTKPLQKLFIGMTEAGGRASNSVTKGLRVFNKRSRKSSRNRRDGLVRDSLRNASVGFSAGMNQLGLAPYEIARRISTRRVWKTFRALTPGGR